MAKVAVVEEEAEDVSRITDQKEPMPNNKKSSSILMELANTNKLLHTVQSRTTSHNTCRRLSNMDTTLQRHCRT